jgi:hypothetical protein
LNDSPAEKEVLLASLARPIEAPQKLRLEEKGATNERLLAHIESLQSHLSAMEPIVADHSVPMQDKTAETSATNPTTRGFLRRLRSWIGF